jgi:hypothetical protein
MQTNRLNGLIDRIRPNGKSRLIIFIDYVDKIINNRLKFQYVTFKEGLQKSFLRTRHPIKSMAYVLFIGEKLSFAEVS